MRFSIDPAALKAAVDGNLASGRESTLPVLRGALVRTTPGGISVTTTTLGQWLTRTAEAAVEEEGAAVLDPGALAALCGLPAPLKVSSAAGSCVLSSGRRRYTLAVLPAEDFPAIDRAGSDMEALRLEGEAVSTLAECLREVLYAAAVKDPRFYLHGVFVDREDVVATDGHRLALAHHGLALDEGFKGVILPRESVPKLLEAAVEGACVRVWRRGAAGLPYALECTGAGGGFWTALVDDQYVQYRHLIPRAAEAKARLTLEAGPLREAVGRLVRMSRISGATHCTLDLEADAEGLRMTTVSERQNEDFVAVAGEAFPRVRLEGRYLDEALRNAHGGLELLVHGEHSPLVFIDQAARVATNHLIMPIRS